jgi:hypothetical protein
VFHCKGNLTILRRILYLDLAKGNPKRTLKGSLARSDYKPITYASEAHLVLLRYKWSRRTKLMISGEPTYRKSLDLSCWLLGMVPGDGTGVTEVWGIYI